MDGRFIQDVHGAINSFVIWRENAHRLHFRCWQWSQEPHRGQLPQPTQGCNQMQDSYHAGG